MEDPSEPFLVIFFMVACIYAEMVYRKNYKKKKPSYASRKPPRRNGNGKPRWTAGGQSSTGKYTKDYSVVVRNPGGGAFPEKYICCLRWGRNDNYNPSGSTPVWRIYRTNSLYDPYYAVGGTQPYGFDQLCPTLYNQYRVVAFKITVTFMNDTDNIYYVSMSNTPSLTSPSNIKGMIEDENSQCKILGSKGSNQAIVTLSSYRTVASVFGVPKSTVTGDDLYHGDGSNNPAYTSYAHIGAQPHNSAVLGSDVHFKTDIMFYCVFNHPVKYAQS